jgi:hypothetical protein
VTFRSVIAVEYFPGTPQDVSYWNAKVVLENGDEREYCASTLGVTLAMLVDELDFDAKFFNDDPRLPVGGAPMPELDPGVALRKERVE